MLRASQFIVKRHGEDALTNAAVLLFGKNVRGFFPHCRIRYIKVNGTTRFARNPLISRVRTEMELVRELNEGVPHVFSVMKESGLPEPKILATAANVTLVLYNGKTADSAENASDKHLSDILSEGLSVNQQKILKMIIDKSYTNASDAAKMIHISRNSVNAAFPS